MGVTTSHSPKVEAPPEPVAHWCVFCGKVKLHVLMRKIDSELTPACDECTAMAVKLGAYRLFTVTEPKGD